MPSNNKKYSQEMREYNLGICYHNGYGIEKSTAESVYWWLKTSTQGHDGAKNLMRDSEEFFDIVLP
jgi:FOG: TPR repeat, SEL1 subfamily